MKKTADSSRSNKLLVVSILAIVFFIAFLVLFFHGGYPQRIISLFSKSKEIEYKSAYNDKAVDAWDNCLSQLHADADIAFLGDSITRRGDFDSYFPDKVVCNLGLGSDTIIGMTDRISMVKSVSPEKVFIMGSINSLRNDTLDQSVAEFDKFLSQISDCGFQEVYVLSVLPISAEKSTEIGCSPDTIKAFNDSIYSLSEKYNFTYIDLYSSFVLENGFIRQELTTDGVHLTDEAYKIWIDSISGLV